MIKVCQKPLRILVSGGRTFSDSILLDAVLQLFEVECIIHGGAKGADALADTWARMNLSVDRIQEYPAQWDTHGKRAGPIRNIQMLDEGKPDVVIAFPGGSGTDHMMQATVDNGVTLVQVFADGKLTQHNPTTHISREAVEPVTEKPKQYSPKQWLLIDLANSFGKDKELFDDRLAFGRTVLPFIQGASSLEQLKDCIQPFVLEADEKDLFAAACLAVWDVSQGKPTNHAVELDACNSGAQLMSLMTRCVKGMKATGAINTGERPDLYSLINRVLSADLPRKVVKNAVVPHLYGSISAPKTILGEEAYPAFLTACEDVMPGVEWAKCTLINAWNSKALFHEYTLPDGFVAHLKVLKQMTANPRIKGRACTYNYHMNHTIQKGEPGSTSLAANVIHSMDGYIVREMERRCNYDRDTLIDALAAINSLLGNLTTQTPSGKPDAMEDAFFRSGLVSLAAVDYIQQGELGDWSNEFAAALKEKIQLTLEHSPFVIKTNHDAFACHPEDVATMKQHYNILLSELYRSTWLFDVIEDLTGVRHHDMLGEIDPTVNQHILQNVYSLC